MGFGQKTDYRTQRTLDLDKTYKIIASAVEACGLRCIRADDIVHSGVIDKPMYEQLLNAEVAIADLSTSNENAIYELGVRHALRPSTTIVIAEKQFRFPFDVNHLLIRSYEHLGSGIDFEEAERLRSELTRAIKTLLPKKDVDSPVYTFLPELGPPRLAPSSARAGAAERPDASFTRLLQAYKAARARDDFEGALALLKALRALKEFDPYLIQQHALVVYKSKQPTPVEALREARTLLEALEPRTTHDPETLGLWGAVHKRLYEELAGREDLEEATRAYERGFQLRRDHYTGINYAYLLDVRAPLQSDPGEAITDRVLARRVRRQIVEIVDATPAPRDDEGRVDPEATYWLQATKLEALLGLGERPRFAELRDQVYASAPERWMRDSTETQLAKLASLLL
jgi:hypothetical protein